MGFEKTNKFKSSGFELPTEIVNALGRKTTAKPDGHRVTIVQDTREQRPLDFTVFPDVRVVVRKCWPGDYTVQGASRLFAVERKSVADLIGTMTEGYAGFSATSPKRFDATLLGLRGILALGGVALVLVEPDHGVTVSAEEQIRLGNYRSAIPPETVLAFVSAIRSAWGIPVHFADSRAHAAEIVRAYASAVTALKRVKAGVAKTSDLTRGPSAEGLHP